jgi:hypothetical protein
MTRIAKVTDTGVSRTDYLYYLLAPTTGANNVVISLSGSNPISAAAATYYNVKQSGQPDAQNVGNISGGSVNTVSVTTVANNCWLVGAGSTGGVLTIDTGTSRAGGTGYRIFDSNGPQTPAGSHSLAINSDAFGSELVVASISPAPDTTGGNFLMFM